MRTFIEHITNRITDSIQTSFPVFANGVGGGRTLNILITGGGAFNTCLLNNLKTKISSRDVELEEADSNTINFKEALIFGFLGLRCLLGLENVLSEVTGSNSDSVSGNIHLPLVPSMLTPTKVDRFNFHLRRQRSSSSTGSYWAPPIHRKLTMIVQIFRLLVLFKIRCPDCAYIYNDTVSNTVLNDTKGSSAVWISTSPHRQWRWQIEGGRREDSNLKISPD